MKKIIAVFCAMLAISGGLSNNMFAACNAGGGECQSTCEYPCDFMMPPSQPCAPSCATPFDPCPCAPVCGTDCGFDLCCLGVGVAIVGVAAAAVIISSNGTSSHS